MTPTQLPRGFSIVELMVVLIVIALLAAVSLPTYQKYSSRAKINAGFEEANQIRNIAVEKYIATGTWPSSIRVQGLNIPINTWVAYPKGNIVAVYWNSTTSGVRVTATIKDLGGISGYVAPTATPTINGGSYSAIRIAAVEQEVAWKNYCGTWTPDRVTDIPIELMPSECTCTNIEQVVANNFTSCTHIH